jgi:4,5-DOPA dioxygenase extradiol
MTTIKQPAIFISHGSPMMAIETSLTSEFLKRLGRSLPKPEVIVVFSAHLDSSRDILITSGQSPETIHDFYGFPEALYQIRYPAPGNPALAEMIADRLRQAGIKSTLDSRQGWDHGVWIPLRLMFPQADIPVVQVSINSRLGARGNYQLGQLLAFLREQGVMIIGSGNMTHNLRELFAIRPTPNRLEMTEAFRSWVHDKLKSQDSHALLNYIEEAPFPAFNHPTQEHFLPLIAALGSSEQDRVKRIHDTIDMEILAMDAYLFGGEAIMDRQDVVS